MSNDKPVLWRGPLYTIPGTSELAQSKHLLGTMLSIKCEKPYTVPLYHQTPAEVLDELLQVIKEMRPAQNLALLATHPQAFLDEMERRILELKEKNT
jgi:hypothetical protein